MLKAFGSGPAVEGDKSKARSAQRAPLSAKAGQSSLSQWQRRNAVLNEIQPKIKRRKKREATRDICSSGPGPVLGDVDTEEKAAPEHRPKGGRHYRR